MDRRWNPLGAVLLGLCVACTGRGGFDASDAFEISASAVSPFCVELSWSRPVGSTEVYHVRRGDVVLTTTGETSYVDYGAPSSTTLTYQVRAVVSVGQEMTSRPAAVTTPGLPGRVFHVAESPVGDDANDGSSGSPWATLQHAADNVAAGDSVMVRDGTYSSFVLTTSGTEQAPIAFRASGALIESGSGSSVSLDDVGFILVEGFELRDAGHHGIRVGGAPHDAPTRGVILRGNVVVNADDNGISVADHASGLVEGNSVDGAGHFGIVISHGGSDGNVVRNNRVARSQSGGFLLDADVAVGNTDGIISGTRVEGNEIYDNRRNAISLDGAQYTTLSNNLMYGNENHGVRVYRIGGAGGPVGIEVVNNTVVVGPGDVWCLKISEEEGANVVFNNILLTDAVDSGSISVEDDSLFAGAHNAVVDRMQLEEATPMSLVEWQGRGLGVGSRVLDPATAFTRPESDNYHLHPDSAARDAGLLRYSGAVSPLVDIDGDERPVGSAIDLGADEIQ